MAYTEMREATFLILSSLAEGKKHGYAIISEAESASGGRVVLRPGTLYAALDRLSTEGLVATAGDEIVNGRLRRYFELTDSGALTLSAEAERMRLSSAAALRKLKARPARGTIGGVAVAQ